MSSPPSSPPPSKRIRRDSPEPNGSKADVRVPEDGADERQNAVDVPVSIRGTGVEAKASSDAPGPATATSPNALHLLSFSDDVLLLILRRLSHADLLRLSKTCAHLSRVCADHALWRDVDARTTEQPLSLRELRKLLPLLHARTWRLALRGFLRHRSHPNASSSASGQKESVSPSLLQAVEQRCPQMDELILEDCFIDASKVRVDMFFSSLRVLRLRHCEVVNILQQKSYFSNVHQTLPNLRVLDLTGCGWFNSHSMLALCKMEQLEELVLARCFRIGECFAYAALSTRVGFRKLRKLDLRDTNVGNTELPCYGHLPEMADLRLGRTRPGQQALDQAEHSEGDGQINDRGLLSLCAYCPQNPSKLTHLTLTHVGDGVTNESVARLAQAFPLQFLDVSGTGVTEAGKSVVQGLRPKCRVVI